jgi:hypothetical protein
MKISPLFMIVIWPMVYDAQADSTPLPWFGDTGVVVHEWKYPAGFAHGIVVDGSVAGNVYYATPYAHLPHLQSASNWLKYPSLLHGATEIAVAGRIQLVTDWWQVLDHPLRYEPFGGGSIIFNATFISSYILNATTIFADAVVTEPTAMWFDGDHSLRTIYLREPAYEGTLKITAITSPRISHLVELQKDNHYVEITQPGLLGARAHIIAVSPMEKWWKRVKFKFEYVPVR